ncbi:uncharacterized protein LOC123879333 [Maniola jurtina]|uniref:uncharacterized protein LOC123879333 n=1 Tax=Maniola jurtina TaxID=191418 RepID=UPI001E68A172|nr:uncharacterized protein LOC123879333 [Maniola jurtina]
MGNNIYFFIVMNLFFVATKAPNPRSVNIALETSLLFQPGEENFSFINKIRSFIDQIQQAITPVKAFLRTEKDKPKIFSKFIEKITRNIIKYDDEDLEEIVRLLANEAENVLNAIEVFNENTKRAIVALLKEYSRADANQIRKNLQNALNGNEIIITKLADKFNSYYDNNDKAELDKLIDKSDKFAKKEYISEYTKTDIHNMVKDFINILKDKYDTLNETAKVKINRDFGNILQYVDLSKILLNDNKRNAESKDKLSKHHVNMTKKGNLTNTKEIIVNKDIEIFVKSINNEKNGTERSKKNSKGNDLRIDPLGDHSVDLSMVLDELNKS